MVKSSQTSNSAPVETSESHPTLGTILEHQIALEKKVEALEQHVLSSSSSSGGGNEIGRGSGKVGVFWDVGKSLGTLFCALVTRPTEQSSSSFKLENCSPSATLDASGFVRSLLSLVSTPGQRVEINAYYGEI